MASAEVARITRVTANDPESPDPTPPQTPTSPAPVYPDLTKRVQALNEARPSTPPLASSSKAGGKAPILKYKDRDDDPEEAAEKDSELANAWGKQDGNGVVAGEEFASEEGEGSSDPVNLLAGREEAAKLRQAKKEPRPPRIERIWKDMYKYTKHAWKRDGQPLTSSHQACINKGQSIIERECAKIATETMKSNNGKIDDEAQRELAQKLYRRYKFPVDTIQKQMEAMAGTMNQIVKYKEVPKGEDAKVHQAKVKEKVKEQVNLLLDGFAVFQEKLKEWDIPLQALMSDYSQAKFEEIVNESPESQSRWKKTLAELQKPTEDQAEVWTQAAPQMQALIKSVAGTGMILNQEDQALRELTQKIKDMDSKILAKNNENMFPPSWNRLPVSLMDQLRVEWENENESGKQKTAKELEAYFKGRPLGQAFLAHSETDSRLRKLVDPRTQPAPEAGPSRSEQPSSLTLSRQPASQKSVFIPESLQSLRCALEDDDAIEMFEYKDGRTEFGIHEATRPCQTDNIRFTRFIVNAGTVQQPYYSIIQGNELCPGGAEALLKNTDKETIFDLRERKLEIKANPSYIKKVGPCVMKLRSDTYKATPGSRTRRPDTYIQVHYQDAKVEWLTRTEYVQLVGKKCAERHLEALTARYVRRTDYIKQCKSASVHPTTGAPLNSQDRLEAPWLFSNTESPLANKSEVRQSESSKMDWEPEVDTEDAPSPRELLAGRTE